MPDAAVLVRNASAGIRAAQQDVAQGLRENADRLSELSQILQGAAAQPDLGKPDLSVRRLRLSLEAVQVTDPFDPALTEDVVDVAVRVLVDGVLVAGQAFRQLPIPEPDRRGIVLRLDGAELAELEVWPGTTVEVVVAASEDATGPTPRPVDRRGGLVLDGDPDEWSGHHRGVVGDTDPWRPWVRVEVG